MSVLLETDTFTDACPKQNEAREVLSEQRKRVTFDQNFVTEELGHRQKMSLIARKQWRAYSIRGE